MGESKGDTAMAEMPTRTRQPRAVRESAILNAAHGVFSEKGFEKAAVTEIAKQAGVSEGTVYKYFDNKHVLLSRVIGTFYEKLIQTTEASLVGISGVENQLRVIVARHIDSFFEDIGLYRVLLQEVRPLHTYPDSVMHQLTKTYSGILLRVIDSGIAQGEIRQGVSPHTIRDMIFGCLEHAAWNVLVQQKRTLNRDMLANDVIGIVLGGVATQGDATLMSPREQHLENTIARLENLVNMLATSTR